MEQQYDDTFLARWLANELTAEELREFKNSEDFAKYAKIVETLDTAELPEFVLREKEFQQELNDAINSLSEKQREVFLLNRIEKKKYREIAEMLGISQKAVEKRMHQAMLHLKSKIKNYKL